MFLAMGPKKADLGSNSTQNCLFGVEIEAKTAQFKGHFAAGLLILKVLSSKAYPGGVCVHFFRAGTAPFLRQRFYNFASAAFAVSGSGAIPMRQLCAGCGK